MCLILVARAVRTDAPLILAANRDEFVARPTRPASFWDSPSGMLAGRDLLRGGTWLGVSRSGRFAAVTNIRDVGGQEARARSRGELPVEFLASGMDAGEWIHGLEARNGEYGGYNLFAGDVGAIWYTSNRLRSAPETLPEGVHGLSNSVLRSPWPKVVRGARDLEVALEAGDLSVESIFEVLADGDPASDSELPDTGVGLENERLLSSRFVRMPGYGTRTSTVVLFGADEHVTLVERTWPVPPGLPETRWFRFRFDVEQHAAAR